MQNNTTKTGDTPDPHAKYRQEMEASYKIHLLGASLTPAENTMLEWIKTGTTEMEYDDPLMFTDALHPIQGGMTLEMVNIIRQVHHASLVELQKTLREFCALEIPCPELSAQDFLTAWIATQKQPKPKEDEEPSSEIQGGKS